MPNIPNEGPDGGLGGADAVEKTTYVTGAGTEPERMHPSGGPKKKAAPNAALLIMGTLFVLAVLVWFLKPLR
jgi:hypothetical protein